MYNITYFNIYICTFMVSGGLKHTQSTKENRKFWKNALEPAMRQLLKLVSKKTFPGGLRSGESYLKLGNKSSRKELNLENTVYGAAVRGLIRPIRSWQLRQCAPVRNHGRRAISSSPNAVVFTITIRRIGSKSIIIGTSRSHLQVVDVDYNQSIAKKQCQQLSGIWDNCCFLRTGLKSGEIRLKY